MDKETNEFREKIKEDKTALSEVETNIKKLTNEPKTSELPKAIEELKSCVERKVNF